MIASPIIVIIVKIYNLISAVHQVSVAKQRAVSSK